MKKLGLLILAGIFAFSSFVGAQNANRGQRQGRGIAAVNVVTAKNVPSVLRLN